MTRFLKILLLIIMACALPLAVIHAADAPNPTVKEDIAKIMGDKTELPQKNQSGLPVPRFASFRSGEVNMRTGPGTRYPIEWVYNRQGLPVEITAEYDIWRRVRDPDGAEGWVHKNEISGRRAAIVAPIITPIAAAPLQSSKTLPPQQLPATIPAFRELHDSADDASDIIAHLEPGAIGQLVSCAKDWCKLKLNGIAGIGGVKGYVRKTDIWGAYPDETFN
jgi:SH3-like domain-containing protein